MRGETQRVAERVRELVDADRAAPDGAPVPDRQSVTTQGERAAHGPPGLLNRLAARLPVRLDPGHRAAVGVGVAVAVVAVLVGAWLWASGPRTADVGAPVTATPIAGAGTPRGSSAAPPPASPTPSPSAATLVVDVAGKVVHPGLYHLAPGSRVADALAAAGGARRGVDLTPVNLAAPVADGQQIVVGVAGAGGTAAGPPATGVGSASAAGTVGATTTVDLNTASLDQLETLPGIGPALGQRILDYRAAHGSFSTVDQLNDVSGIGDVRFAQLKPLVAV